jgi:F0F1-type ATP synthase assembly protein I
MRDEKKSSARKFGESLRAEGLAFAIPMVLVTYPLSAALLGRFLESRLEVPFLTLVGLLLGLTLGIREAIRLIRKLNRINS